MTLFGSEALHTITENKRKKYLGNPINLYPHIVSRQVGKGGW
jgi:hypothetical protein